MTPEMKVALATLGVAALLLRFVYLFSEFVWLDQLTGSLPDGELADAWAGFRPWK